MDTSPNPFFPSALSNHAEPLPSNLPVVGPTSPSGRAAWPSYSLRLPVQVEHLERDRKPEGARFNITSEDLGLTNEQSTLNLPTIFWYEV